MCLQPHGCATLTLTAVLRRWTPAETHRCLNRDIQTSFEKGGDLDLGCHFYTSG